MSMAALVLDSEGQDMRKDSTVPLWAFSVAQHSGNVHIPSLFQGTQCPDSASTRNFPERSLACEVAFSTSHGEEEHVLNSGWHLVNPRNPVCRYCREESVLALVLSFSSQNWRTADLVTVLTWSLVGWDVSQATG